MPIQEFLWSVRAAARLSSPEVIDSPSLNPRRIQDLIAKADLWLSTRAVTGYNKEEFGFLGEDEKIKLDANVTGFLAVAHQVDSRRPAPPELVTEGGKYFRGILEIVRPDRYGDLVAFELGKKIEREIANCRPEWLRELVFETGYDADQSLAIWIWIVVDDDAAKSSHIFEDFSKFGDVLRDAVANVCPDRWPYIRMRTVSERSPTEKIKKR